jgi:hypothetical protein
MQSSTSFWSYYSVTLILGFGAIAFGLTAFILKICIKASNCQKWFTFWTIHTINLFFIFTVSYCSSRLLYRAMNGICRGNETWNCNTIQGGLPVAPLLAVLLTPTFLSLALKATFTGVVFSSWFISSSTLVISVFYTNSWDTAFLLIVPNICVSFLVLLDNQSHNFSMFELTHNLASTINQNLEISEKILTLNREAAEKSATELRHMIGNVAHDLKTVCYLTYFLLQFIS